MLARGSEGSERKQLLRDAIGCFDAALQVRRQEVAPSEWILGQLAKGRALDSLAGELEGSERRQTAEDAIGCFDSVLKLFQMIQREVSADLWMATQNNKGRALATMAAGLTGLERRQAWEAAVTCYDAALNVGSQDVDPKFQAAVQENKSAALAALAEEAHGS
jgi:hypothetical protein